MKRFSCGTQGCSIKSSNSRFQRLSKSTENCVLGGVCGGLGNHTGIPAWVWRILFLTGICVLLIGPLSYLVLWIALPEHKILHKSLVPRLFRKIDWISFAVTTFMVFIGYFITLAPDLTLEDSGELAVGSYYAGVPHPPGYPVWTLYSWLFTLLPISNIAFRVGLSSAFAGALSCGMIALMVSRGSSMFLEGIAEFKNIERKWENELCVVTGCVAGMLMAFNGFMWSQAVIVEVYTLSVLSLAAVLVCLMRWIHAPHQRKYLYFAFFWFGICFNNHQSLLVIAMGLEVAVIAAAPRLGRSLLLWSTVVFLAGLLGKSLGMVSVLNDNDPLLFIYFVIGIAHSIGWV